MPLSDRDRALLDFEARWARHAGAKEEAIRAELGLSPARYYQLLGRLIETAAAVEHDPMLVKRLRRIRDARAGDHWERADRSVQNGPVTSSGAENLLPARSLRRSAE